MSTHEPTVSTIVTTFDRCHSVARAIHSVLDQTYTHFELIVVDDASSDDTRQVAEGLEDERIRYVRHRVNRGAPAARNTGIELARGQYIAFLDDDDWWHPEKLQRQVKVFKEGDPRLGVVCCHVRGVSGGASVDRACQASGGMLREALTFDLIGCITSSMLIRASALKAIYPLDESLPGCQDTDLKISLSVNWTFDFVDDVLVFKGEGDERISTDPAKDAARRTIIEKYDYLYSRFPLGVKNRALAKYYYEMGRRRVRTSNHWGIAVVPLLRALILSPGLIIEMIRRYSIRRSGSRTQSKGPSDCSRSFCEISCKDRETQYD